jgi:hypothetical protein
MLLSQYVQTNLQDTIDGWGQALVWVAFVFWVGFLATQIAELLSDRELTIVYEIFFLSPIPIAFLAYVELGWHTPRILTSICGPSSIP